MPEKQTPGNRAEPGFGAGVFFLIWAALGWYGVLSNAPLIASFGGPGLDPGPSILPMLASSALTAGGFFLVLRGVVTRNFGVMRVPLRVVAVPLLFLASALIAGGLIGIFGFIIPGFVFAALWLVLLNARQKIWWKRIGFSLLLAALVITLIQIVFVQLLRVPLP